MFIDCINDKFYDYYDNGYFREHINETDTHCKNMDETENKNAISAPNNRTISEPRKQKHP